MAEHTRQSEKHTGKIIDDYRITIPCSFKASLDNWVHQQFYTISLDERILVMSVNNLKKYLEKWAELDDLITAHVRINPAFFSTNRCGLRINLSLLTIKVARLRSGDYVDICDKGGYVRIKKVYAT